VGNRGTAPLVFNLGIDEDQWPASRFGRFTTGEIVADKLRTKGREETTDALGVSETTKIVTLLR
jgi:hypothetical protein